MRNKLSFGLLYSKHQSLLKEKKVTDHLAVLHLSFNNEKRKKRLSKLFPLGLAT